MKKVLLRLILVLSALALLIPYQFVSVSAAGTPAVSFASDKKDDKLIVSVYYENVEGLTGTGFQLYYSREILKPEKVTHNKEIWKNVLNGEKYIEVANLNANGTIKYSGAFLNDISDITDNTDKFHFADIVFDIVDGKQADVNGSEITIKAVFHFPGKKLPVECTYVIDPSSDPLLPEKRYAGDVNNDGKVTAFDARILLRYSVALEDIAADDLPYGNMDFNHNISAADARLALRTSVNLEKLHKHYYEENEGKYICLYCKKSFSLENKHIHKYDYSDCFSSGKCTCGADNKTVRGHVYSASQPVCSVCGVNAGGLEAVSAEILNITAKIQALSDKADSGNINGESYPVIEAALYIVVYYEDIIELTKEFSELQECREEFMNARDILDGAIKSVTASSGDIYVNSENAVKLNNARLSASENAKQAVALLDAMLEKHNLVK